MRFVLRDRLIPAEGGERGQLPQPADPVQRVEEEGSEKHETQGRGKLHPPAQEKPGLRRLRKGIERNPQIAVQQEVGDFKSPGQKYLKL